MAIIGNITPSVDVSNLGLENRIVIKFRSDIKLPYSIVSSNLASQLLGPVWAELNNQFNNLNLIPFFRTIAESSLSEFVFDDLLDAKGGKQKPFLQYFCIDLPTGKINAKITEKIAGALRSLPIVEAAYVESCSIPPYPLTNYTNNPHSFNQGYLEKAPKGIDAQAIWKITSGEGTKFVDLEQGWTLNHQDLVNTNIQIISGINHLHYDHGTKVLGVVSAVNNNKGGGRDCLSSRNTGCISMVCRKIYR